MGAAVPIVQEYYGKQTPQWELMRAMIKTGQLPGSV